jgi:hypothetical protein
LPCPEKSFKPIIYSKLYNGVIRISPRGSP